MKGGYYNSEIEYTYYKNLASAFSNFFQIIYWFLHITSNQLSLTSKIFESLPTLLIIVNSLYELQNVQ